MFLRVWLFIVREGGRERGVERERKRESESESDSMFVCAREGERERWKPIIPRHSGY